MQCHSTNNIPDPCRRSARSKQFQTNYLALLTDLEALGFSLTLHNQNWHPQSFQQSINLLPACPPPQLTEEPSPLSPPGPEQYISRSCSVQIIKYFYPMQGAVYITHKYVCMDFDHPWSLTHPYISLLKLIIPSPNPIYAHFHVHILAYITLINYTLFLHTSPWSYPIQCLEITIARHLLAICTEDVPVVQSCIVVMITSAPFL